MTVRGCHTDNQKIFVIYLKNNFSYLFLAVLGLRCSVGFSLAVARGGSSLVVVRGLLTAVAALVAGSGLQGVWASVVCTPWALGHSLSSRDA